MTELIFNLLSIIHEENKMIMKMVLPPKERAKVDHIWDDVWNEAIKTLNTPSNSPVESE